MPAAGDDLINGSSNEGDEKLKTVLLAGGFGTRITEESERRPKPMVEIGGMPILWHIMKGYSHFGFNEFIICAGYKQHMIKEWFADYFLHTSDITFDFTQENRMIVHNQHTEPWKVTIVDTVRFHKAHGKAATLTAIMQKQQKGVLDIGFDNSVHAFREKAMEDSAPINAGYMVLEPAVFDFIEDDSTVFEQTPLEELAKRSELKCYLHSGFWQCMDTLREKLLLERLWQNDKAPWKLW